MNGGWGCVFQAFVCPPSMRREVGPGAQQQVALLRQAAPRQPARDWPQLQENMEIAQDLVRINESKLC